MLPSSVGSDVLLRVKLLRGHGYAGKFCSDQCLHFLKQRSSAEGENCHSAAHFRLLGFVDCLLHVVKSANLQRRHNGILMNENKKHKQWALGERECTVVALPARRCGISRICFEFELQGQSLHNSFHQCASFKNYE